MKAFDEKGNYSTVDGVENFFIRGSPKFILDAVELFYDLLQEHWNSRHESVAHPNNYQQSINIIFEEGNLCWRMTDGRIIQADSKWIEDEVITKAHELLRISGFEGALYEFQEARSELSAGECKSAMHNANLAFESTIKSILGIDNAKPGELIRKLVDSGLIPEYHQNFLKVFEEHILRSVAVARNFEKGVGHGQGTTVNEPPKSLAELAVNLSGVLILYLLKRHLEKNPITVAPEPESSSNEDDLPF